MSANLQLMLLSEDHYHKMSKGQVPSSWYTIDSVALQYRGGERLLGSKRVLITDRRGLALRGQLTGN